MLLCITPGLRPTPQLTAAQAYAARWDLSPYPSTRQGPIVPREPIIEPFSPRINLERNLFTPKFSSISMKDKRSFSKVTPLYDHRSLTLDEIRNMKEESDKKNCSPLQQTVALPIKPTNNLLVSQMINLRPKSTPCAPSTQPHQPQPCSPCQKSQ